MNFIGRLVAICDSKESKARSKVRSMLQSEFGFSSDEALEIDTRIHNDIHNYGVCDWKYAKAIARIAAYQIEVDEVNFKEFDQALGILGSNPEVATQFDENLNNMSAEDFISEMQPHLKAQLEEDKQRSSSTERTANARYQIVCVPTFEDCVEYGEYTDWCIAGSETAYEHYTNNGANIFYFCLRDDYKNVEAVPGPDAPFDDYGLSMIAVSVNPDGSLDTSTSRWNFDQGGYDHLFSVEQLEDILGVNFYDTFKPRESHADALVRINGMLTAGERDIDKLFGQSNYKKFHDDLLIVNVSGLHNLFDLKTYKFISRKWYFTMDPISDSSDYVLVGYKSGKCNCMNGRGQILHSRWFDTSLPVTYGFVGVELDGKWNYINTDGNFISDRWYDSTYGFESNGLAIVKFEGKYNYINTDGNFISDRGFDWCYSFDMHGRAEVELNGKHNFIDENGNPISDKWYDYVSRFDFDGHATATLDGKKYTIDIDGNILTQDNNRNMDFIEKLSKICDGEVRKTGSIITGTTPLGKEVRGKFKGYQGNQVIIVEGEKGNEKKYCVNPDTVKWPDEKDVLKPKSEGTKKEKEPKESELSKALSGVSAVPQNKSKLNSDQKGQGKEKNDTPIKTKSDLLKAPKTLQGIKNQIKSLQEKLETAAPSEKEKIMTEIKSLKKDYARLQEAKQ